MSDKIAEFLDISELSTIDETTPIMDIVTHTHNNTDIKLNSITDYAEVRANLKRLSTKGMQVIDSLAKMAIEAQSARDYEVLTLSLKNLTEINLSLLDVNEKAGKLLIDERMLNENGKGVDDGTIDVTVEQLQKLLKE